jgi:hypothetical protein
MSAKETLTIVLVADDHGVRRAGPRTYRLMHTAMLRSKSQ